jgi:hypothetical protein
MINGSMDVAGEVIDQVDTSKISNLTTRIANKINSGNPQELINAYTSVTPSSTTSVTPSSTISMTPSSTISMTPSSTTLPTSTGSVTSFDAIKYDY